jgi:hypothetical protein
MSMTKQIVSKTPGDIGEYWIALLERTCPETVAGWLWYCDEHNTHGNADSEDEAAAMVDAHIRYFLGDLTRREHANALYVWQIPVDPPGESG